MDFKYFKDSSRTAEMPFNSTLRIKNARTARFWQAEVKI
jgi:hypothetical protein